MPLPVVVSGTIAPRDLLLQVTDLAVDFGGRMAFEGVTFDLFAGETLGLVGESGSGKSTLARALLRLIHPCRGSVVWCGTDLLALDAAALRPLRRDLQIVFQDPLASLNPRMTVGEALAEPLRIFKPRLDAGARRARVVEMLARVGLAGDMLGRYPHEFSGGQCQRIGIARAMILRPKLLVCDEPVSSLDVSIQGQIINLLLDLQRDAGTALLFISHNLAIVRHISHRVLVMYAGALIEVAPRDELFESPVHPYTRALLAAVPALPVTASPAPAAAPALAARTETTPPAAANSAALPALGGCQFRGRCPYARAVCTTHKPPLEEIFAGHFAACHRALELAEEKGSPRAAAVAPAGS